jgi:hypothetical protein
LLLSRYDIQISRSYWALLIGVTSLYQATRGGVETSRIEYRGQGYSKIHVVILRVMKYYNEFTDLALNYSQQHNPSLADKPIVLKVLVEVAKLCGCFVPRCCLLAKTHHNLNRQLSASIMSKLG